MFHQSSTTMLFTSKVGLLSLLILLLIFHLLVVIKIIPYTVIWGGKINSDKEMYRFEGISFAILLLISWISFQKIDLIPSVFSELILNVLFWIVTCFFALNTIGNLLSKNKLERIIFTPLALFTFVFCLILSICK